jgi:sec-independent protein translocase protein TatC
MGQKGQTIEGHLGELRQRLIVTLFTIVLATVLCLFFGKELLAFLIRPVGDLVFIAPTEVFITYLKLALFGGIFLSIPVILFESWQYIASGLKPKERKYILVFAPFSLLLFLGGAAFAYLVVLPLGLNFLLGFAPQNIRPMISVAKYVAFATRFLLAFGIVFEVPLMVLFLTKVGLVTPAFLSRNRKYVVLIVFITAAILTPPDIVTQVLLAVPLLVLFEFSLLLARFVKTKK